MVLCKYVVGVFTSAITVNITLMTKKIHLANFLIGNLPFYASFESKVRFHKIPASINQPRLYRDSAGHFE